MQIRDPGYKKIRPRSGMEKTRIRDRGQKSRIRDTVAGIVAIADIPYVARIPAFADVPAITGFPAVAGFSLAVADFPLCWLFCCLSVYAFSSTHNDAGQGL